MTTVSVVYHSGYGHTKRQAEAVAEGAKNAGTSVHLIAVTEMTEASWAQLATSDAIIMGAPTYMGSLSAPFKEFMDKSSKVWFDFGWKNKIAAGFTNSGSQSGDKLNSIVQLMVFANQHAMIWVGLDLMPGNNSSKGSPDDMNRIGSYAGAMAQSNVDQGAEAMLDSDLKTAAHLGRRVAEITSKFVRGQG